MSSADICPPPPWPITMLGLSRSGSGHVHPSKARPAPALIEPALIGPMLISSDTRRLLGVRGPHHRIGQGETSIQVVRRAGSLAGDHRCAQRIARRAFLAESSTLVRFDQALQYLAA